MSTHSKHRLLFLAALAVCAGVVLIGASRVQVRRAAAQAVQAGSERAAGVGKCCVENACAATVAADVTRASSSVATAPVGVSVSQILPQVGYAISDWRAYRPEKMTIAPHADLALEFQMTSVREENGRTIWHGRNALTGAFLVTVATENDWHAVLDLPAAGSFEFHVAGQIASVTEKNEPVRCGESPILTAAEVGREIVELTADTATGAGNTEGVRQPSSVDVLFFYDAATLVANGGSRTTIETTIASRVEAANLVLENSQLNSFRWRFVAAYQVPEYVATGKLADDLGAITFTDLASGQFVWDKCELHGADQALIFVSGNRDYAGLAWVPAGADSVAHYAAARWDSSYTVMTHELAHNFGCRHDRRSENAAAEDRNSGYGFRFDWNGEDTGTVMSYAPNRVPYFSNPDVNYHGIALGVACGQAGAANNTNLLIEKSPLMIGHRVANRRPIITEQPQGTTVRRGTSLTLKVSATGEGLSYQWRRNGNAIPDANTAIYTKSAASDDDSGSYDVVVTNSLGQDQSATAAIVVAVSAAEPLASASTSGQNQSAGAGGGGGAPGHWFFAALTLLCAARAISRRRSAVR